MMMMMMMRMGIGWKALMFGVDGRADR